MERERTIITPVQSNGAISQQSLLIDKSIWMQLIEATWEVTLRVLSIVGFLAILSYLV